MSRSIRRARKGPARRRVVSPSWQRWVADNLLRGVEPLELVEGLVDSGVPRPQAERTVADIVVSPGLHLAHLRDVRARQLALVARLQGAVAGKPAVPRVPAPDWPDLVARYWAASAPAIFPDIVPRWRRRWTPTSLAERFGDVTIEACTDREADPSPDANWRTHRVTLPLREYVDRMLGRDRSNDLYLIANNRNTARPQLRVLWDDVVLPEGWFDPERLPFGSALWLGPAGTITPMHHDTSNILFCQVHGQKRVVLVPPWSAAMLESADGVYNRRMPEDLAAAGIESIGVTVEPGEALFIPAGWWHDVRALTASVSLAINAFTCPNGFDWFRPGSVR